MKSKGYIHTLTRPQKEAYMVYVKIRPDSKVLRKYAHDYNDSIKLKYYDHVDLLSKSNIKISIKAGGLKHWQFNYLLAKLRND